jgi:hypothetical protein
MTVLRRSDLDHRRSIVIAAETIALPAWPKAGGTAGRGEADEQERYGVR